MDAHIDEATNTIEVELSEENVQNLVNAFKRWEERPHTSSNVFSLTKLQLDGSTVRVTVNRNYAKYPRPNKHSNV